MGWDYKTGKPSAQTLADLGLTNLTQDLIAQRAQRIVCY